MALTKVEKVFIEHQVKAGKTIKSIAKELDLDVAAVSKYGTKFLKTGETEVESSPSAAAQPNTMPTVRDLNTIKTVGGRGVVAMTEAGAMRGDEAGKRSRSKKQVFRPDIIHKPLG